MRLTDRGRIVVAWLLAPAVIGACWALSVVTAVAR